MTDDEAGIGDTARPPTIDDLKRLISALNAEQVDYVLIGGYALYALGYQCATTDIDLLVSPLEFMQRLVALIQPAATAPANDRFGAVNLGCRTPGLGRGLPTGLAISRPVSCRSD